jgi:hypothetical protein
MISVRFPRKKKKRKVVLADFFACQNETLVVAMIIFAKQPPQNRHREFIPHPPYHAVSQSSWIFDPVPE